MTDIKIETGDCECVVCEPGLYARRERLLRARLRRWLNRWWGA